MPKPTLHLQLQPDRGQPFDRLLEGLTPAELVQANRCVASDRRARHYVLGRLAAHAALRRAFGDTASALVVEVLTGPSGEPVVRVDGAGGIAAVSIAHSGCLAAALAWREPALAAGSVGVDLERVRPSAVSGSDYAFSRSERRLLWRARAHPWAGLVAWTVKEAAWKALWPASALHPAAVEIRVLSLATGRAVATAPGALGERPGRSVLWVRSRPVCGPDGLYILSVAQIVRRGLPASGGREGWAVGAAIGQSESKVKSTWLWPVPPEGRTVPARYADPILASVWETLQ